MKVTYEGGKTEYKKTQISKLGKRNVLILNNQGVHCSIYIVHITHDNNRFYSGSPEFQVFFKARTRNLCIILSNLPFGRREKIFGIFFTFRGGGGDDGKKL